MIRPHDVAEVAQRASAEGRPVVAAVAEAFDRAPDQAASLISYARQRGYDIPRELVYPQEVPGEWTADAECKGVDPDLFFPQGKGDNATIRAAKAICAVCPVADECLDYALRTGQKFGVWGGTSERERKAMRKTMRVAS